MSEPMGETASAIASAVTGPDTPDGLKITRPTQKSEWTLLLTLGALCIFAMIIIGILSMWFGVKWPVETSAQRIHFLGWMGFLGIGGILLIVIAIASPWVGHVSASAGTASLSIDGQGGK